MGGVGCLIGIVLYAFFSRRDTRKERIANGLLVADDRWGCIWLIFGIPTIIFVTLVLTGDVTPAPFHWSYPILAIILFPDRVNRIVCIPAGWARPAYHLTALANFVWNLNPRAGAVSNALLACARRPGAAIPDWLPRRTLNGQGILVSTDLLASALRRDLEGDTERARILMESVLRFPYKARGRRDQAIASRWLLLDAARTGRWERMAILRPWTRMSRLGFFFRAVADGLLDRPVSAGRLRLTWLLAPRPWATWPLLRRALKVLREGPEPDPADASAAPDLQESSPLPTPSEPELPEEAVRLTTDGRGHAAAEAWGDYLDGARFESWLRRRCEEEKVDPERLRREVNRSVSETLDGLGVSLGSARPESWDEDRGVLLTRLEEAAELLEARSERGEAFEPMDEVEAWCSLRRLFDDAAGAGVPLVLAYRQVEEPLWNWAVWLFNKNRQRAFGQSIFAWLHDYAMAVGDEETAEQMRANLKHEV